MIENMDLQAVIEAVLFSVGEPIEMKKLASSLEITLITLSLELDKLKKKYESESSGLTLLTLDDKVQLCSKKQFAQIVRTVLEKKKNTPLSAAAFEVLAIIAYNQPVTKSFIEQIRGVDCSGVVSSLCQKELIEEKGRLEALGRPLLYGTTDNFLRCFCISSLSELPPVLTEETMKIEETKQNEEKTEQIEEKVEN